MLLSCPHPLESQKQPCMKCTLLHLIWKGHKISTQAAHQLHFLIGGKSCARLWCLDAICTSSCLVESTATHLLGYATIWMLLHGSVSFPPCPCCRVREGGNKKIAWKLWHVILFEIIVSIVLDQFSQVDRTYHDQAMNHSWTLLFKVPSLLKVFRHCNARIDQSPNLPTCHNILTSDNCQLIQLFCMTVTCQMF